jgi:acetylornithine deacetylase/succinyl-diaminopimelate desuccinylase-like protein
MNDVIAKLSAHARIRAARHHIERTDDITLTRQAALSAIPAPTGAESARGLRTAELFREIGLGDVLIDGVGNVHGWLRAADQAAAPVILAAPLDTVFGPDVPVAVERRGQRLEGPGISDNARGLAALIAVAEALVKTRVATASPILFVIGRASCRERV